MVPIWHNTTGLFCQYQGMKPKPTLKHDLNVFNIIKYSKTSQAKVTKKKDVQKAYPIMASNKKVI